MAWSWWTAGGGGAAGGGGGGEGGGGEGVPEGVRTLAAACVVWAACAACLAAARALAPGAWAALHLEVTPVSVSGWSRAGVPAVERWARRRAAFLRRRWFACGVWACGAGWAAAVALLGWNLAAAAARAAAGGGGDDGAAADEGAPAFLGVAIPGVTLPWDQVGYLWVAVLLSVAFHELGHALAAAAARVPVLRFGFFTALCFPGAYVEIDQGQEGGKDGGAFGRLPARDRMAVAAAGVWHNVVLCAAAALAVRWGLPAALWPAYAAGGGAHVVSVNAAAAPGVAAVLAPGDAVVAVDGAPVAGAAAWADALAALAGGGGGGDAPEGLGHCVRDAEARALAAANGDACCEPGSEAPLTCLAAGGERFCASARALLLPLDPRADGPDRCGGGGGGGGGAATCAPAPGDGAPRVCVRVDGLAPGHAVVALAVRRAGRDAAETALFAGSPWEPLVHARVSDHAPRAAWLPASLPLVADRALRYTFSVSASLALLNSAPVHFADGALFTRTLAEHWGCPGRAAPALAAGTALLAANLGVALWQAAAGE